MNRRNFLGMSLKAAAMAPVAGVAAVMLADSGEIPLSGPCDVDSIALLRNDQIIAKTGFRSSRYLVPGDELTTHWPVSCKGIKAPSNFGATHLKRFNVIGQLIR